MIKVIPPNAWSDLGGPQVEMIKVSSCGLRGTDLAAFIKRASHPLADWVRNNPPKAGEVYVHSLALGAHELWGGNRNGDLYGREMLKRDHNTFEKSARWYRNHQNSDPAKSYGVVKKSYYHPTMDRVETITALNGNKEAADRNGGLIAERTLEKMAAGHDVAVSQSCKVPGDYCNGCGNFARSRAEYCGPAKCIKYGGCRDNLGRVFEDGHQLMVDNRNCHFFDLSDVSDTRGADRIAFATGKVAESRIPGGAELAELMGLVPPDHLLDPATLSSLHAARKLAGYKAPFDAPTCPWAEKVAVRASLAGEVVELPEFDKVAAWRVHGLLADLAAAGVILPPAEWLAVNTGIPAEKCAAVFAGGLDVDRDLLSRPDCHDLLSEVPVISDNRLSVAQYAWLAPSKRAAATETARAVIGCQCVVNKSAAEEVPAGLRKEAAARYLAYQARILAANENSEKSLLLYHEAFSQNRPILVGA